MHSLYLIGLTGNLGSGKSTVRRMLEQMGAAGIDADQLGHAAMERGTPAWSAIVDAFGVDILHFNGKIDRRKLGARVFANPEDLRRLEAIVHPAVRALIQASLRRTEAPVAVVEAIKLVESNLHLMCDALWVVTASPEAQIARVEQERQTSQDQARATLAAQSSQEAKVRLADVVIDNSGDLEATRTQVQKAWRETIRLDAARDKTNWLFGTPDDRAAVSVKPASPPPQTPHPEPAPDQPAPDTGGTAPASGVDAPICAVDTPASGTVATAHTGDSPTYAGDVPGPNAAAGPAPVARLTIPAEIEVRRARRTDLDGLAVALGARDGRPPLTPAQVLKRLGERGYRIAVGGNRVVALVAWEAENLVAIVRDVWSESAEIAPRALTPLLALVEQDARALQCEVLVILLSVATPSHILEQVAAGHYQARDLKSLHPAWRQVVEERGRKGDQVWVKRLREDMVTKPV